MQEPTPSSEAHELPTREEAFVSEVYRILEFFAAQVQLNVSMNSEGYDSDFHEKSKRRAVRSLLAAVAGLDAHDEDGKGDGQDGPVL